MANLLKHSTLIDCLHQKLCICRYFRNHKTDELWHSKPVLQLMQYFQSNLFNSQHSSKGISLLTSSIILWDCNKWFPTCLDKKEMLYISQPCRFWENIFHCPAFLHTFILFILLIIIYLWHFSIAWSNKMWLQLVSRVAVLSFEGGGIFSKPIVLLRTSLVLDVLLALLISAI